MSTNNARTAAHVTLVRLMRAVVQRVTRAEVRIDGASVGRIDRGLCALIGAATDDTDEDAAWIVDKIAHLRVFADENGQMNKELSEVGGGLLLISQFTLYGDCRKGRRPSFVAAMPPGPAEALWDRLLTIARATQLPVATGRFRADMQVDLINDGPVTLLLDSKKQF
jgi:D-tyrosyl-tRNA(Tyr) deacylase